MYQIVLQLAETVEKVEHNNVIMVIKKDAPLIAKLIMDISVLDQLEVSQIVFYFVVMV
jgi:hypothetical protein